MICSSVHKRVIHDIQIYPVLEHLVIFLQSEKLHFTVSNLIIKINQFITVCGNIFPKIVSFKCQVCILAYHIKIFVRSFPQQFAPTSLMFFFLRIKIAIHCTRSKMNLNRLRCFRILQCFGMIHHIYESFPCHCQFINTAI